jgi:hypothetical protein
MSDFAARRPTIPPDPVIEAYKKDIDRTLLRENLKLTVEERFRQLQQLADFAEALRGAARKQTSAAPVR